MSGTKPKSGVTITLTGDASDSTVTDVNGEYSFDLPNGDYNVEPSLADHVFTPTDTDVTIADGNQTGKDFTAAGVYTISGTIVDGAAAGIEGVTVTLSGDADDSTTTDGDGAYSFTGLVDGSYTVTPSKADYAFSPASANVTISGADDTGNDFTSSQLWDISGTVVDANAANAEGVTITLSGDASDSTTTAADGTYSFAGLLNGDYTVTPSFTGVVFNPTEENVTVADGDQEDKDFAASELSIPFMLTFDNLDNGNVSTDDGFYRLEGSAGVAVVGACPTDSNSYKPNTTKALILANTTTFHTLKELPLGVPFPSGITSLRMAILYYNSNGNYAPFVTSSLETYEGNGGSNSGNCFLALYNPSTANNGVFFQFRVGGVTTQVGVNRGSVDGPSTRWMWTRAEIRTSNQHDCSWFREEDATQIDAINNNNLALAAVLQMKYIGLINDSNPGDCAVAKIWIGTASDDWPT